MAAGEPPPISTIHGTFPRLAEDAGNVSNPADPGLVGYFYLPGRLNPASDSWSYSEPWPELAGWATRQKFGGQYHLAPVMSDRLQGTGTWSTADNKGTGIGWTDSDDQRTVPCANHAQPQGGGVPSGGNFLFEDGHVTWSRFDINNARGTVDIGCAESGWVLFYKLPGIPDDD